MKFFNRVKERREGLSIKLGNENKPPITQWDLAESVGCSRIMIWKIENGMSQPGVILALKICKALGSDAWDLFPTEAPKSPFIQSEIGAPAPMDPAMAKMIEAFGLNGSVR